MTRWQKASLASVIAIALQGGKTIAVQILLMVSTMSSGSGPHRKVFSV